MRRYGNIDVHRLEVRNMRSLIAQLNPFWPERDKDGEIGNSFFRDKMNSLRQNVRTSGIEISDKPMFCR